MPKPSLSQRLLRYSAVASTLAAGGLLTTPQAYAGATVRDINVTIDNIGAGDNDDYYFDFDLDGHYEADLFMFEGTYMIPPNSFPVGYTYVRLLASSNNGDKLLGVIFDGATGSAAVLNDGDPVNATEPWGTGDATLHFVHGILQDRGKWQYPEGHATDSTLGAYLGLKLQLDGEGPYYGWVELHYPDREHITIKRIGYGDTTGQGLPASVMLASKQAAGSWQLALAGVFAALSSTLTWLRRKLRG